MLPFVSQSTPEKFVTGAYIKIGYFETDDDLKFQDEIQGNLFEQIEKTITNLLQTNPSLLDFSKWGFFLPIKFQVNLLKQKYFDFNNAEALINSIKFVYNKE